MALQSKSRVKPPTAVTVSFSDSIALVKEQVRWTPKGVCLLTKWPFQVGAEVEFAFDHQSERHCCAGVVVACHPLREPSGHYEVVLYFVETPCSKLQKAACECKLAEEGHQVLTDDVQIVTPEVGTSRLARRGRSGAKSG